MNIIAKMQVDRLLKLDKCDMENIGEVSSLASSMGMKALLTQLYTNSNEYLEYVRRKRGNKKE